MVNYLLVAGGAGGGGAVNGSAGLGGGGGAGGLLQGSGLSLPIAAYPVVIGAGGAKATSNSNTPGNVGNLTNIVADAKTAGWNKVMLATVLPSNSSTGPQETQRGLLNTSIVGNAAGADVIVDYASDSIMGNPANTTNTLYYADGTHPTEYGYTLLFPYLKTALTGLGFSLS